MTRTTMNRNSNIELLRILAMFLVLVQHANFLGIGIPNSVDCLTAPANTFIRFFVQSLAIVAVNVFVLISGWFGIKPSIKKLLSLLFQVFFFTLSILIIHAIIHGWSSIANSSLLKSFMITKCYWFVKSYLCLFILSPVLNIFVEKASKRSFALVLIGFFVFQTIFGWTDSAPEFNYGYSAVSFCGLYLLARFLKIYPINFVPSRNGCLLLYLSSSTILAIVAWLMARVGFHTDHSIPVAYSYINPVIIFSSLALFYCFAQKEVTYSKAINWIATSSFSVYIIHINAFLFHYFQYAVWYIYSTFTPGLRSILILLFLVLVFVVCILIDKIRLLVWHMIEKAL